MFELRRRPDYDAERFGLILIFTCFLLGRNSVIKSCCDLKACGDEYNEKTQTGVSEYSLSPIILALGYIVSASS